MPPVGRLIPAVALLALASCAPRLWTREVTRASPLSVDAESPQPANPGRALIEEPPLPGESTEGWPGLEEPAPESATQPHPTGPAAVADVEVPLGDDPAASREVAEALAKPLTAEAAVRIALLNNREARAVMHELGAFRGRWQQAGVLPNPELEVETLFEGAGHAPALEAVLEYDITDLVLAPMRSASGERSFEAAKLRAAGRILQLSFEARSAFHDVTAAQERLATANRVLDGLAAARDTARALHDAGNTRGIDLAAQVAAFESARATTAALDVDVQRARERLNRVLGLHGGATQWRVQSTSPAVPAELALPERLEADAVRASLELQAGHSELEALSRRSRLLRWSGALPEIALGVRTEREDERWLVGATARVTLPVFDRRQGDVAAVVAQFDAERARLDGLAIDVRSAARELRNGLVAAHRLARSYEERIIPARRELLQQSLLQYNAMQIGIFQLIAARQALLDAQLAEAGARRDFWSARAALETLLKGQRVSMPRAVGTAAPSTSNTEAEAH